jgi:hypothetical protein
MDQTEGAARRSSMIIRKRYRSAFVVERSKLTRLLAVIRNALHHHEGGFYRESFEAHLAGAKGVATEDIQHILELDNSERSRVEGLLIRCEANPEPGDVPAHEIEIDFDGRPPDDVTIRANTNTVSALQATEILARQLKIVIAQRASPSLAFLTDWRLIVIILPAAIAVVAQFALASCYPQVVFLWGDAEEWYQKVLSRRGLIWNVVLATLFLGIMANLAVFALGSLISGPRPL